MPRSKRPSSKRQRESEDVVHIEPPPDHPLGRYFSRLDDLNHYVFNFYDRKEISPRYLDIKLLETHNFNTLSTILKDQGLEDFVQIRETYYPELVAIAFSTLSIDFNEEHETEFTLKFRLHKNDYQIDSHTLSEIWNLQNVVTTNYVSYDENKTSESWGPHVKQHSFDFFNIQRVPKKKILCNVFNMEMRLLHYLINYVLIPRSTGHPHVQVDDVVAMWAMNNDIKIHWPYFIAQHMLKFAKSEHSKGMGYMFLWTRIFKKLGVSLDGESARLVAPQHAIDTTTLHHMGRGVQVQEQDAPPPPQEQEAGPSEQSSMRDMMEILQRMELNQQNLDNRFQSFEQGQERMDRQFQRMNRRLQRIEQSMGIHQEEDEDQN
ncbi:hypothetical protein PIB30_047629 [Stylosanthes scabra]|uniref:Putative plant transposon protein domain-containing protein n=1 Tax=Stylosanthes scabra TaxID=79078 RepID=A0ABU6SHK7_9FABA|nr:hypothetical protein [Stylosanthes scabra]